MIFPPTKLYTLNKIRKSTAVSAAAAATKSLQSCPTLCDPMGCSLPGSSVHGIFQARVLEWVAIAFSDYYLVYRFYLDCTKYPNNDFMAKKKIHRSCSIQCYFCIQELFLFISFILKHILGLYLANYLYYWFLAKYN